LNAEERKQAPVLYRALHQAANAGKKSAADVVAPARKVINEAPLARVDYIELRASAKTGWRTWALLASSRAHT